MSAGEEPLRRRADAMNTTAREGEYVPGGGASLSGQPPEEIERRIEHTRRRLDETLSELQSKLSPRERLRSLGDSTRRTAERWGRRSADSVMPDVTTMIRLDHTHVLALFRRFHRSTSIRRKEALVASACLALEIHATLEEEIFYPALRQAGSRSDALEKSVPEHDEMRALISVLRAMAPEDADYDDTFRTLMKVVLHHVADEESMVLPEAEDLMPERLTELALSMTRRRMELLRPHLGEVVRTSALSFPVITAATAVGFLAIGWLLVRPSRHGSD
jgi:hemerythrin superfamily protein